MPEVLKAYVDALVPWAERAALRMIQEVNARDRDAWHELGASISQQLHRDLREAPIGNRVQELMQQQVTLIQSIPLKAAERAHELVLEGLEGSKRASEVATELLRTTEVTTSRATLIARTETSRVATVLVQTRAEAVGSTHYVWRTAGDADVRPGHQAMAGKVCEWANPPAVEENGRIMHFHPGSVWNCRCYSEPVISDPHEPQIRGRKLR